MPIRNANNITAWGFRGIWIICLSPTASYCALTVLTDNLNWQLQVITLWVQLMLNTIYIYFYRFVQQTWNEKLSLSKTLWSYYLWNATIICAMPWWERQTCLRTNNFGETWYQRNRNSRKWAEFKRPGVSFYRVGCNPIVAWSPISH